MNKLILTLAATILAFTILAGCKATVIEESGSSDEDVSSAATNSGKDATKAEEESEEPAGDEHSSEE